MIDIDNNNIPYYVDKYLYEFYNKSMATATEHEIKKVCLVIKMLGENNDG